MDVRPRIACLALAIAASVTAVSAAPDGPTKQRPLTDFLNTQGTTNINVPPVPDYLGWIAPAPGVKTPTDSYVGGNSAACDYAGLANRWLVQRGHPSLGTSFTGSVTERKLSDGRILVQVELHTTNALTYGLRITAPDFGDFANDPLIFGARAQDVFYDDATPGIGECHASLAWKQSPGPLVDLTADTSYEWVTYSFRAQAKGPLTALAGYGPDGTPGHLMVSQTGVFHAQFRGATADAFPAEFVEVRGTGK
jgi:hypothetical protein